MCATKDGAHSARIPSRLPADITAKIRFAATGEARSTSRSPRIRRAGGRIVANRAAAGVGLRA